VIEIELMPVLAFALVAAKSIVINDVVTVIDANMPPGPVAEAEPEFVSN
jgi:hypothetical protein